MLTRRGKRIIIYESFADIKDNGKMGKPRKVRFTPTEYRKFLNSLHSPEHNEPRIIQQEHEPRSIQKEDHEPNVAFLPAESEDPQQITAASVQLVPATAQVQPKPKRPRVAWNSEALKALEESVGPLNALGGSLPGFGRLQQIRNSTQVLQKYSVEQIYQKIYKMNYKK